MLNTFEHLCDDHILKFCKMTTRNIQLRIPNVDSKFFDKLLIQDELSN